MDYLRNHIVLAVDVREFVLSQLLFLFSLVLLTFLYNLLEFFFILAQPTYTHLQIYRNNKV